ncbi:MAG: branched-chain amino acid ABC transporter substrate-binding protein [Chloroflexota bacterium]
MEKFLRWSAGLMVLALILAACQPSASASPTESAAASLAEDPAAACEALPEGCFEVAPGDPIRIASALSITGAPASLGNDSNFGIDVAQGERGQVLGRDTDVVHEDAGCADAASGQTAAQAIVADTTILGVIGTSCSRTAVPAMPVLEEAGLIMISPSNTAPGLTNPDHEEYAGPNYFRTAYNDRVQGAAVATFACDQGWTTAATIHDGSPYADQLQQVFVDQFAEICGGTTTAQEAINIGDTDFRPVLTTIAADSPELLFFPIFEPEGNAIIAQWDEVAGLADTIPFSADGLKTGTFLEANGLEAQALGSYFSGPDLNFGDRYQNEFLPAYYKLSGTEVTLSAYHAHGYDAYNILMDAIEAAVVGESADGTLYISKAGVREHVAGLADYDGLTGTLTCDEFGDCGSEEVSIAQIGTNAAGNLDYLEVFTTRSAQ